MKLADIKLTYPFENPQRYRVVFPFGAKYPTPRWWGSIHNGVDFDTPVGVPILAMHNGKVIKAGYDQAGYGHYLKIIDESGKFSTLVAHLKSRAVDHGQKVKTGQIIGISGKSGSARNYRHLHLELRKPPSGPRYNPVPHFTAVAPPITPPPPVGEIGPPVDIAKHKLVAIGTPHIKDGPDNNYLITVQVRLEEIEP